jgi:hypothetical protein
MLSFTDDQINQLKMIASMLPSNARANFIRSIGNRLVDLPYPPSNADVQAAIDFVLSCRGVAGGVQAFCNTKTTDKVAARTRAELQFNARSSL